MPEDDDSLPFSEETQRNASRAFRLGMAAYCWVLLALALVLGIGFVGSLIWMALSRH